MCIKIKHFKRLAYDNGARIENYFVQLPVQEIFLIYFMEMKNWLIALSTAVGSSRNEKKNSSSHKSGKCGTKVGKNHFHRKIHKCEASRGRNKCGTAYFFKNTKHACICTILFYSGLFVALTTYTTEKNMFIYIYIFFSRAIQTMYRAFMWALIK